MDSDSDIRGRIAKRKITSLAAAMMRWRRILFPTLALLLGSMGAVAPAMAGTFITEVCLSLSSTIAPNMFKARLGVTHMGNNHFQLNGVIQDSGPGGTSPTIAVSGDAEIRTNGDIIMSASFQGPVDAFPPGAGESDSFSIFLPVAGGGTWSNVITSFDLTVPPVAPGGFDFNQGTAAIVPCASIGF